MVWVYDDTRLNSDEKKVMDFIHERTHDKVLAERSAKLFNLVKYLRSHKFKSAKHLEQSVFYDKKHTLPMFNDETAKLSFESLKHKGGYSQTHPVTDRLIRDAITNIQSFLPPFVSTTTNGVYSSVVSPVTTLEESIPLLRTLLKLFKASVKLGDSAVETVAADLGGPIGEGIVAIPVAFVGSIAALVSVLEDDLGGAVAQVAQATPFIGPTLSTLISTIEENFKGGKRFSTYKHRSYKWQKKTKRIKSVRS